MTTRNERIWLDEKRRGALNSLEGRPEHNYELHYSLKPGDVYVEAGAYYGAYGRIASRKVGPQGRVILIEPVPEFVAALRNINLPNVEVVPKCVWSSRGWTDFTIYGSPLGYHKSVPGDRWGRIRVEMDTIDNILGDLNVEKVDLLACDVEGAECELLQGADRYLTEKRILNLAIMAYHQPGYPQIIKALLERKGYSWILIGRGTVFAHV